MMTAMTVWGFTILIFLGSAGGEEGFTSKADCEARRAVVEVEGSLTGMGVSTLSCYEKLAIIPICTSDATDETEPLVDERAQQRVSSHQEWGNVFHECR